MKVGLAETQDNKSFFFPYAVENTGSEDASAQRVRKYRERQALQSNANVLLSNADVTDLKHACNVEKEIEKRDREESENKRSQRAAHFSPPTVDEVAAYCRERGNHVDPQRFVDFYLAKGWKIGKDSMRDWRAAVRTWERRDGGKDIRSPDRYTYTEEDSL